jgi:hypothetical protein
MTRNGYLTLLGSVAAIVIASAASLGLAMLPAIAQNPGQIIVTSPGGTELVALQTSGPQSAAISLNNIKTFVNSGGTGGPGSFTTLTASSTVTLSPASANVAISPTGTGTVTINPATASAMDNVVIGGNTALAGTFTTLTATNTVSLSPASHNVTISPTGTGTVTINPATASAIDNETIGATTPLAGKFTTLTWTTSGGATGAFGTDSGQTATATVCEDTTSHVLYFGSGTAGICKGTSSMRFKENIGQIAYGLPEVMKLQPVSYYTKAQYGDSNKQLYGFLAEDTAKVMPKGVTEYDAKGDPSSVDYIGLVPVLVKAIQQQQAQIEELKHKLNAR